MTQAQDYELKLAVSHHNSLKTQQLIEYLQNESNDFLSNDLPHSLTQDHFVTVFEPLQQANQSDFTDYVGLLLLYSSASVESFEFAKKNIPKPQSSSDLFMIIVEMDNTDKKTNAIGDEGQKMCKKNNYQFVRFTLYNSEDLVTALHRNLYQLIQNYYYPNQQQRPSKNPQPQSQSYILQYSQPQSPSPSPNRTIIATKQQKKSIQKLLDKASQLRESRQNIMLEQQKQIDESINNVEKILNNINEHISKKKSSQWFISLNHTLYSPLEKNSVSFAKIKLTQEFCEDEGEWEGKEDQNYVMGHDSKYKHNMKPSRFVMVNKAMTKYKKIEPILKLVLAVADSVIVELQVFENSSYDELAVNAMKKFGITETEHNHRLMRKIIVQRIENFVKELSRAVKFTERSRIDERSYLQKHGHIDFSSSMLK